MLTTAPSVAVNSASSRLLPMPASPLTQTVRPLCQARVRACSGRARPISRGGRSTESGMAGAGATTRFSPAREAARMVAPSACVAVDGVTP